MAMFEWMRRGLTAIAAATLASCTGTPAVSDTARPALWRVADADTTVYLFGTIHLLPPSYRWRTEAFDTAMSRSDGLVVETEIDSANPRALAAEMAKLGFRDGLPPLLDRVPAAKRAGLATALGKTGIPAKVYDRMETWAAAFALIGLQFQALGLRGEDGVETVLRNTFKTAGKPIAQLETNSEQLRFFDALSEPSQRQLLEGAVDDPQAMREQFDGMLKSWSRGDIAGIARAFNAEMGSSPELMDVLLKRRNANWAKWIEARMTTPGSVMVAVGAGHLAGEGSVQSMLERRGYRVKRLQ